MEQIGAIAFYWWICNECGAWSPKGYSPRETEETAREQGWIIVEFQSGSESVIHHLCPACAEMRQGVWAGCG